jgi:hypothetical protein
MVPSALQRTLTRERTCPQLELESLNNVLL